MWVGLGGLYAAYYALGFLVCAFLGCDATTRKCEFWYWRLHSKRFVQFPHLYLSASSTAQHLKKPTTKRITGILKIKKWTPYIPSSDIATRRVPFNASTARKSRYIRWVIKHSPLSTHQYLLFSRTKYHRQQRCDPLYWCSMIFDRL